MAGEQPFKQEPFQRKRKFSNPPILHKEFEALSNQFKTFRVRVIQYKHDQIGVSAPMLDIREFLKDKENADGTKYTGYSPNGISLTKDDLEKLFEILPDAIAEIERIQTKEK